MSEEETYLQDQAEAASLSEYPEDSHMLKLCADKLNRLTRDRDALLVACKLGVGALKLLRHAVDSIEPMAIGRHWNSEILAMEKAIAQAEKPGDTMLCGEVLL